MADNKQLPATGTGTADIVVATDQIGGVEYQRVKLSLGADGTAADAPVGAGTEAGVLRVALPTDGTGRVTTGLAQARISQTPTVSTTPAYTAKDAVGGLLTFANAARVSGGAIILASVVVVDLSQQMPALELVLFDRTFTNSTDNAVFDPTDADLLNVVGVVPISAWSDFSDNAVATRMGLGLAITLNGTSLFGQLLTRSTPTFVGTSDITVIVNVIQQ